MYSTSQAKFCHTTIIWTEQVTSRNIHVCTYTYTCILAVAINEKRVHYLKESRSGVWEGLERAEGMGRCNYIIISEREKKCQ